VLPEAEELAESAGMLRVAWMTLILAGTVLLGLMLVNTGMLSQILRDLGVVPTALTFLRMPLAYVFAFILTLVEAGLGVAHGATRSENPAKLSVWPSLMTLFAVILACVEGFFYSRVAPSTGTFSLPFVDYEMPQMHLFFFWGFVLVMTLFSLGSIGFEACATVLRSTKSGTLRREMKELRKQHERYACAVKDSEEALQKAKTAATDADEVIRGPAANAKSVHEKLDSVLRQMEALKAAPPEWAKDNEAALTRTEVHHYALIGGVCMTSVLVGMVLMTNTGVSVFAAFKPDLRPVTLWIMAVGQAVVSSGVGFLLGWGETVVQGDKTERRVWAAPRFSRWGAYVIGTLLVITYIALFFIIAWPMGLGVVWFFNLLFGLFLIAAGYQLSPLLYVVRLWLSQLWNVMVLVLEALWLALIRLLQLVVVILGEVSYLLATPLEKVSRGRRERRKIQAGGPESG
jgi:ABC-type multidrug transport system fused ATPase/permease subunit